MTGCKERAGRKLGRLSGPWVNHKVALIQWMSFLTSGDLTHSQQSLALRNQQLHLSMHCREGTLCPFHDLHLSVLFELETDFKDLEEWFWCKIPQMTLGLSFRHNSCVCFCFHQAVEILLLACSNSKAESFPLGLRTCWLDNKKVNPRFGCILYVPSLALSFHSAILKDLELVRIYKY